MWVRFLTNTRWKPHSQAVIRYSAGQVVNLPAGAAKALVESGKAAAVKRPKKQVDGNTFVSGEDGATTEDMISA